MKAILTYSGKGGVGKTSITYMIYKGLKAKGHSVSVVDLDLNTPSLHRLMGKDNPDLIYNSSELLYISSSIISKFVTKVRKILTGSKPDYVLIDTPPSITEIHLVAIDRLKVSTCILVTQPSDLAITDLDKTAPFFISRDVPILGVVENMTEGQDINYRYEKLASIPLKPKLDSTTLYEDNMEQVDLLVDKLVSLDVENLRFRELEAMKADKDIPIKTALAASGIFYSEKEDGRYEMRLLAKTKKFVPKFISPESWRYVEEFWEEHFGYMAHGSKKDPMFSSSLEQLQRIVQAFREEPSGTILIQITKDPGTEIPVLPGEIGPATLCQDSKFGGLPTYQYHSGGGAVRLFPFEATPVELDTIEEMVSDGDISIDISGSRWIPTIETLMALSGTFGSRVGLQTYHDEESLKSFCTHYEEIIQKKLSNQL